MSHWNNFPASSSMTDFEIVVVQNERARWEREAMEQQETSHTQEQDYEDVEDALVTNILSRVDPTYLPVPITPIHQTPSPTLVVDTTTQEMKIPFTEEDQAGDERTIIESIKNQNQLQQLEDHTQLNNESNNSSSSSSYQSVPNTPTKVITITDSTQIITITEEDKHNQVVQVPILFRGNDTMFMTDINKMNVNNKKRTNLISVVRPSFHSTQNEFFICHVCHKKPRQIKIVEELWEIAKEKGNKHLGDELPFAYNLRGIIDHLTNYHCLTHEDKSRDMIVAVANYIDMVNKDIEDFVSPMFCFEDLIPKASSTSCLHASWKTDQPELTMELAHKYNFQKHTSYCHGHSKSSAPSCSEMEYELDLANTVYCSCSAPTIDLAKMDRPVEPVAKEIFDLELNIFQEKTFFNQERKSIHQSHKAVLCHFKIPQPWPKFPKRTYQPSKPITRNDTKEKLLQDLSTVKTFIRNNPNSQFEAGGAEGDYPKDCLNFIRENWDVFSLKDDSSEATTSSRNSSNPEQNNFPQNSCQISPPGDVRLRPEGSSPPNPPEASSPQVPPLPRQVQPPANEPAGSSVKAKVGHAVATAASLLRRPARKSDWV